MTLTKTQKHHWTDAERDIVRRDYRHTRASQRELADRLGVTDHAVYGQVVAMGLVRATDRRRTWTEAMDKQLTDLIERHSVRDIAHKMGRSINSVVVRSKRLKLCRRNRDGWFTKKEVCEILGHDHKWVQSRIDCGALTATWHSGLKPQQNGMAMWHIEAEDLKSFIRRYPQELIGCNIDIIQIVDLLAGLET